VSIDEFRKSLGGDGPPAGLGPLLKALWMEAKADWTDAKWDAAHKIVQDLGGSQAAWVHAYLHRREGDLANARFWYSRAERSPHEGSLEDEWAEIVTALLGAE